MKSVTLTALLALAASILAQSCYFADGSLSSDVPCRNTTAGEVSMCCGADAYCFSNGLCISPSTNTFSRGSCTDQSWGLGCARYCMDQKFAALHPCGGNNMACAKGDCSNIFQVPGGEAIWSNQLRFDLGIPSSAASSTSSVGAIVSPTVTATITATGNCTSTSGAVLNPANKGVSSGAAAAIGACIGLPLLIALAAALFMLRRERVMNKDTMSRSAGLAEMSHDNQSSYQSPASGYKYQSHPPAFNNNNSHNNIDISHNANQKLPVEMDPATPVVANELSGTPSHSRYEKGDVR